jgi:hypothetical protein
VKETIVTSDTLRFPLSCLFALIGLFMLLNGCTIDSTPSTSQPILDTTTSQVIQSLKDRDFNSLAGLVHPNYGLRFSPYSNVRAEDIVFTQDQVKTLDTDPTIYHFGTYDGSGEPIDLTFSDYYQRFVYDVNFAQPEKIGYDINLSSGSRINNIAEFYPGASVVEYYFSGFDPQYEGMDWRSLRLIYQLIDGRNFLVGVVHDEWGP